MKHIKTTSRAAAAQLEFPTELYCKVIELLGAPDFLDKCGNGTA